MNCQKQKMDSKKFNMWMKTLGSAYRVLTFLVLIIISVRKFEKYHFKYLKYHRKYFNITFHLIQLQNMNTAYSMNT